MYIIFTHRNSGGVEELFLESQGGQGVEVKFPPLWRNGYILELHIAVPQHNKSKQYKVECFNPLPVFMPECELTTFSPLSEDLSLKI